MSSPVELPANSSTDARLSPHLQGTDLHDKERPGDMLHPAPQPGLCVVPDPSLEPVVFHQADPDSCTLEPVYELPSSRLPSSPSEKGEEPASKPRRKKAKWIICAAVVFVLVVLAAVLGGVLGSRAAKESEDAGGAGIPSVPKSDDLPKGSTVAASAVFSERLDKYLLQLTVLYPDEDDEFHLLTFNPETNWTDGTSMSIRSLRGPQIAATGEGDHLTVLFKDDNDSLQARSYNLSGDTSMRFEGFGTLGKSNVSLPSDSKFVAYGPWRVYQDAEGKLQLLKIMEVCGRPGETASGLSKALKANATKGTELAIVPLSNRYKDVLENKVAVLYQDKDGVLKAATQYTDTDEDTEEDPDTAFPSGLPNGNATSGPFAAFAVPQGERPVESEQLFELEDPKVTIYVVFQTASGPLKVAWHDDDGWHTAFPRAMEKADLGTTIRCTMAANKGCVESSSDEAKIPFTRTLPRNFTRCFFERDSELVEVMLDGEEWVDLGLVKDRLDQ